MQNPKLSADAVKTLLAVGTHRQGAKIWSRTPAATVTELQNLGLIGDGLGLTRKGTIVYDRLLDTAMDLMF